MQDHLAYSAVQMSFIMLFYYAVEIDQKFNYFKLVALIADTACFVIWKFIEEKILAPNSFETFLNREKHRLIHIYETSECCECQTGKINRERLISKMQLLLLYKSDETKRNRKHSTYLEGRLIQTCICNYSAIRNVDVKVVDISLAYCLIEKFGKPEFGVDHCIEHIQNVKNELVHRSDEQKITNEQFDRQWSKLEVAILEIANAIGSSYEWETRQRILRTKNHIIKNNYMLKYEMVCRDYWREKCAEFEVSSYV